MPLDPTAPRVHASGVRTAAILVAHLHRFTAVTDLFPDDPAGLHGVLNRLLTPAVRAIMRYAGVVEQVFGSELMATFGAHAELPGYQARSLAAALGLLRATERVNRHFANECGLTLEVSVGIAAGTVLAGRVGLPERSQMTVVGDGVSIATRLAHMAAPGEVLLAASVYHSLGDDVQADILGRQAIAGRVHEVEVYRLIAWRGDVAEPGPAPDPPSPEAGTADRLRVDVPSRTVWRGTQPLLRRLSAQEFRLLETLYEHRTRVCTREQLGNVIWGAGNWYPKMLYRLVRRLKDKIEVDAVTPRYLRTVPWVGYCLTP